MTNDYYSYRIFELWVGGGGMANIFLNVILRNKSALCFYVWSIGQLKYRNPIRKN